MGIPMGIPMGMGMGWVWGLKFNPHGSPGAWPVWPPGSGGLGSTAGSSGLSVHAGQSSAYSEINISGKHRFDGVLFNL